MEVTLAGEWTRFFAYLGVVMVIFSAGIGALAAISPRVFGQLMRIVDKRFSLDRVVETIDRPINVEQYLKPYTRLLGIAALTSAICVGLQLYTLI